MDAATPDDVAAPLELLVLALAVTVALSLRPWRLVGREGPPGAWLAAWAAWPGLWALDGLVGSPWALPWSGAALGVLLAGWPLVVAGLVPAMAIAIVTGLLEPAQALDRAVWLGLVPATLAMAGGALVRRCGPAHPACYLVGRGLLATWVARTVSLVAWPGAMPADLPMDATMRVLAWVMAGFAEASVTALLLASLMVWQPGLLATWSERLWVRR